MIKVPAAEFQRNIGRYQDLALTQPVAVTRNGRERTVMISIEEYQRLAGTRRKIADALAMPGIADIEFNPPRVTIDSRPANFS